MERLDVNELWNHYLIASDELRARLGEPGLAVIDARWDLDDRDGGRDAYRAGHIPGARYLSWLDDVRPCRSGRRSAGWTRRFRPRHVRRWRG